MNPNLIDGQLSLTSETPSAAARRTAARRPAVRAIGAEQLTLDELLRVADAKRVPKKRTVQRQTPTQAKIAAARRKPSKKKAGRPGLAADKVELIRLRYALCKTPADKRWLAEQAGLFDEQGQPSISKLYNFASRRGWTRFYPGQLTAGEQEMEQRAFDARRLFERGDSERVFSIYEDDYIRANFGSDAVERIAFHLSLSELQVAHRARQLGLRTLPRVWDFAKVSRWLGLAPKTERGIDTRQPIHARGSLWDSLCFLPTAERIPALQQAIRAEALKLDPDFTDRLLAEGKLRDEDGFQGIVVWLYQHYLKRLNALAWLERRHGGQLHLHPCVDRHGRAGIVLVTTPVLARLLDLDGTRAAAERAERCDWQLFEEKWNLDPLLVGELREAIAAVRAGAAGERAWVSHGRTCLNPFWEASFALHYDGIQDRKLSASGDPGLAALHPRAFHRHGAVRLSQLPDLDPWAYQDTEREEREAELSELMAA